eukprot:2460413-Pyramimonas_sp.AAC.1
MRPRNAVLSRVEETHADTVIGALSGAPYGATKRCPVRGRRMRTPPLWAQVELPIGPRSAVLGGGGACGHRNWGLRWSPHLAPRNVVLGGGGACGHRRRGRRRKDEGGRRNAGHRLFKTRTQQHRIMLGNNTSSLGQMLFVCLCHAYRVAR